MLRSLLIRLRKNRVFFNGMDFMGKKIYVGNIHCSNTEDDLKKIFSKIVSIEKIEILKEDVNRNYALVTITEDKVREVLVYLDGYLLCPQNVSGKIKRDLASIYRLSVYEAREKPKQVDQIILAAIEKYVVFFINKGFYADHQPLYHWNYTQELNKAKYYKTLTGASKLLQRGSEGSIYKVNRDCSFELTAPADVRSKEVKDVEKNALKPEFLQSLLETHGIRVSLPKK